MTALNIASARKVTALQNHPASQPVIRVVEVEDKQVYSQRVMSIVRPDRPSTTGRPMLRAVPTASSPDCVHHEDLRWEIVASPCSGRNAQSVSIPRRSERKTRDYRVIEHGHTSGVSVLGGAVLASLAVLAFALGVLCVAWFGLAPEPGAVMTVNEGETLSTIAASLEADVPVKDVISDIAALNDLNGSQLIAGQDLVLPAYGR